TETATRLVLGVARHAGRNGREHEHAIAPDNWRGAAAAGNLDLPFDVLGFAPLERWVGGLRNAGGGWSAPLRPESAAIGLLRNRDRRKEHEKDEGGERRPEARV